MATACPPQDSAKKAVWVQTQDAPVSGQQSQAESILAQIAQSAWPHFCCLHIHNSQLGHEATIQLAKCSLPTLKVLDLSFNQLDEAAMTALVQGSWPQLATVTLAADRLLNADALATISTAAFRSLSQLSLAGMNMDNACTPNITLLHNQLEHLSLADTAIDAAALSEMASAPWPHLQRLTLKGNSLTASAMVTLVSAQMPKLSDLNLADNALDSFAIKSLVEGTWTGLAISVFTTISWMTVE